MNSLMAKGMEVDMLFEGISLGRGERASRLTHSTPVSVVPLCSAGLEVAALLAKGPLQGGALVWRHDGESIVSLQQTHH